MFASACPGPRAGESLDRAASSPMATESSLRAMVFSAVERPSRDAHPSAGGAGAWLWLLAAVLLGGLLMLGGDAAGSWFGGMAGVVAAAAAVVLAAAAWRGGTAGGRTPWLWYAAAAAAAVVGQGLAVTARAGWSAPDPVLVFGLLLLFHPLFWVGTIVALRPARMRWLLTEMVLDALLLAAVATTLLLYLRVEPVAAIGLDGGAPWLQLAADLAVLGSLFCAALLVSIRAVTVPPAALPWLALAPVALAIGTLGLAAGLPDAAGAPAGAPAAAWVAGWLMLAGAGASALSARVATPSGELLQWVAAWLRRGIVPGTAVLLGLGAAEVGLTGRGGAVPVALAVVGILLAARAGTLLRVAERRGAERRQLAHTRALVEVSHALASTKELDLTLEVVSVWARQLLGASAAGIELLAEDERTLEIRAASGLPRTVVGLRYAVEDSFTGWVVRHGRPRATADATTDPFMRPESLSFLGHAPTAAAPLRFGDRLLGVLFACIRDRPFDEEELELLQALAEQAATAIENARLFQQVRALSLTDPLTGLANRRQLERDMAREFAAAQRGRKLVAVLFDVDEFKQYNDTYGHLAGDEWLRMFGQVLALETRAMNLAARYGGDEFVALLSDSDMEGARIFVSRVHERLLIEGRGLERAPLTVSAGLAAYDPEMTEPDELIQAADDSLYEDKGVRSEERALRSRV
jgi:diguanylate cyclase (GGDEF)-like protein